MSCVYWLYPVSEMTYTVSSGTLNSTIPHVRLEDCLGGRLRSSRLPHCVYKQADSACHVAGVIKANSTVCVCVCVCVCLCLCGPGVRGVPAE